MVAFSEHSQLADNWRVEDLVGQRKLQNEKEILAKTTALSTFCFLIRHSRAGGNPSLFIPAQAGIQTADLDSCRRGNDEKALRSACQRQPGRDQPQQHRLVQHVEAQRPAAQQRQGLRHCGHRPGQH